MNAFGKMILLALASVFVLSGCSTKSNEDESRGPGGNKVQPLVWEAVPTEYHPSIESHEVSTYGAARVLVNMFGYSDDVELIYSAAQAPNTVSLHVYKVWANSATWGSVNTRTSGSDLLITSSGSYQCSIHTNNGFITDLDGGCYVRMQIILPLGSPVDVYNAGVLMSNNVRAMTPAELLEGIDRTPFTDKKLQMIETYLDSNAAAGRVARMATADLEQVVRRFAFARDRLTVLSRLQHTVYDRYALLGVIDRSFSFPSDRTEARRICGV